MDATEDDVIGAILCPKFAARLLGISQAVSSPAPCMDHLGMAYLHKVRFDEEDEADYPFAAILKAHESYMRLNSAEPPLGSRKPVQFSQRPTVTEPLPTFTPAQPSSPIALELPSSLLNYTKCLSFNGTIVQGQLTCRHISPHADITHIMIRRLSTCA